MGAYRHGGGWSICRGLGIGIGGSGGEAARVGVGLLRLILGVWDGHVIWGIRSGFSI